MVKTNKNTKTRKKPQKISNIQNKMEEMEEMFNYPEPRQNICEHRWHLVRYEWNDWFIQRQATFICDKCGKIKKIEGREEI